MKNAILRLSALLTAVLLLAGIPLAYAADGFDTSYTYTYDFWEDMRSSPDAYRPKALLTGASLGLDKEMVSPTGLFVRGNDIYVCDTGNNRLLQIREENGAYTFVREITGYTGESADVKVGMVGGVATLVRVEDVESHAVVIDEGTALTEPVSTFNKPTDVYVDGEGMLYIADKDNNRVVKLDAELNYQGSFIKPTDPTFDQTKSFMPTKLVADVSGRVFCLADTVNMGVLKYEANGVFTGFIGAKPVTLTAGEILLRLLSTKEQRAKQKSSVATEYHNIAIDDLGFFYVVTNKQYEEAELMNGDAEPIRRLNSLGTNILIENGTFPPIGDVQWAAGNLNIDPAGHSRFIDVTVLENDIYVGLDNLHSRIFGYDKQGNMLWAFGGIGNAEGYFRKNSAVAIESMGDDLLVLDTLGSSITVMTPTEYGKLIYEANRLYSIGDYPGSAAEWQKVLDRNANYDLAYIGIGRAELQMGNYKEACDRFKMARDDENYSEAFRYYRSELVEQNIGWIFGVVAVILVVPAVVGRIKKIKWEVDNA